MSKTALPQCRLCGHTDFYLGDHLAESHDLSIEAYLEAFPGSPVVAQEVLDAVKKNVRRAHPPVDTALKIAMRDFQAPVNPDVPAEACLPLPHEYRLPVAGDLGIDITEALIAILMGRHTYIHGLPGSGKDALIHFICHVLRRPSQIKQVQPSADVQGWFFSRSFDKDGTDWEEGELLKALRDGYTSPTTGRLMPYTILITDFDRATKAQAETLRLILDSISGRVEGPGGVTYPVFPGTQIIVTANTAGGGDSRGRMVSANVIDGSILDRFERTFEFHWMEWEDEEPICRAKFPLLAERCPEAFDQVGKATASLRDAITKDQLYTEFSHRAVCSWLGQAEDIIAMTGKVPSNLLARAFRAWQDKCPDPETRVAAKNLIDPHIKGGVRGSSGNTASSDPLAAGF